MMLLITREWQFGVPVMGSMVENVDKSVASNRRLGERPPVGVKALKSVEELIIRQTSNILLPLHTMCSQSFEGTVGAVHEALPVCRVRESIYPSSIRGFSNLAYQAQVVPKTSKGLKK